MMSLQQYFKKLSTYVCTRRTKVVNAWLGAFFLVSLVQVKHKKLNNFFKTWLMREMPPLQWNTSSSIQIPKLLHCSVFMKKVAPIPSVILLVVYTGLLSL